MGGSPGAVLGPSGRRVRWRRIGIGVGVLVALVAGLHLATVRDLDRTRREAAAAEAAVATARAEGDELDRRLGSLGRSLVGARSRLRAGLDLQADTALSLEAAGRWRDAMAVEYERVQGELAAVQGVLAGAEGEAEVSARLVGELAGCLTGVSQFLNQLSVGDDGGALVTAGRIEGPRAAVGVALGA